MTYSAHDPTCSINDWWDDSCTCRVSKISPVTDPPTGVVYEDVVPTCGFCGAFLDESPDAARKSGKGDALDAQVVALAKLGASLQHLGALGILDRHNGTLAECETQRCVDAREVLAALERGTTRD